MTRIPPTRRCPHCNGEELELRFEKGPGYYVYCFGCNAHGPTHNLESEAALRWQNGVLITHRMRVLKPDTEK